MANPTRPYRPTPVTTTDTLLCDLIDGQKEMTNEIRALRTEIRNNNDNDNAGKTRRLKEPRR